MMNKTSRKMARKASRKMVKEIDTYFKNATDEELAQALHIATDLEKWRSYHDKKLKFFDIEMAKQHVGQCLSEKAVGEKSCAGFYLLEGNDLLGIPKNFFKQNFDSFAKFDNGESLSLYPDYLYLRIISFNGKVFFKFIEKPDFFMRPCAGISLMDEKLFHKLKDVMSHLKQSSLAPVRFELGCCQLRKALRDARLFRLKKENRTRLFAMRCAGLKKALCKKD